MRSSDRDGPFFLRLRGAPDHSRVSEVTRSPRAVSDAGAKLSLARAARSRDGEWSADDYDVFEGNRQVGRVMLTTRGPQGMPWFWTITARPESTQNRGYAVSCEQAMREFKARWANPARF
jgi:hypothetical protein